jgi:hypothetical protein
MGSDIVEAAGDDDHDAVDVVRPGVLVLRVNGFSNSKRSPCPSCRNGLVFADGGGD